MTLEEVVAKFNTTPFLFAGSGITRRYYGLPDWIGLLTYFAQKVKRDQFAFQYYENKVKEMDNVDKLPEIAGYIEKDFNEEWFKNSHKIRTESQEVQDAVANGVSPFKAEMAEYISSLSVVKSEYKDEVKKLLKIAKNNISGVITTNYDCFFEKLFEGEPGGGYPKERVVPEQRNKKILDGVRAVAFKGLVDILKELDQDLVKGAVAGPKFKELFFANCKNDEIAEYVKTLVD